MRLFGPRVLYVDRRGFDFKPQAERPQQQWIVDQDIIPMVTVHDGFYPPLEALRQFEPDVYEALPLNKRYLTEGGLMDFIRTDEAKKERFEALERLTQLASEDRRELD